MTTEELIELDELLVKLRKSSNANELHFDENGLPIYPIIDKEIEAAAQDFVMDKSPTFLYRYRSANERDLEALRNDHIWLSTFRELNDPFECKVFIDTESIAHSLVETASELVKLMKRNGIKKDHPIYAKYITSVKDSTKKLQEELELKRDRAFISCFCEHNNSLLMWAHYANCHTGFCICYRYEDLAHMYGILNLLPVSYTQNFLTISTLQEAIDHHQVFLRVYRTKSVEWSYEKEWRLFGNYRINVPYCKGELIKAPIPYSIYIWEHTLIIK